MDYYNFDQYYKQMKNTLTELKTSLNKLMHKSKEEKGLLHITDCYIEDLNGLKQYKDEDKKIIKNMLK